MKRFKLPRCPYCGRQVGFPEARMQHTQGEYRCEHCKHDVDIIYDPIIYAVAGLTAAMGVVIYLIQYFILRGDSWYGMLFVLLPFLAFYAAVPFMMHFTRLGGNRQSTAAAPGTARRSPPPAGDRRPRPQTGTAAPRGTHPSQAVRTRQPAAKPPRSTQTARPSQPGRQGVPPQRRQAPSAASRPVHPQQGRETRPAQVRGPAGNPAANRPSAPPARRTAPKSGRDRELENILEDFFEN